MSKIPMSTYYNSGVDSIATERTRGLSELVRGVGLSGGVKKGRRRIEGGKRDGS